MSDQEAIDPKEAMRQALERKKAGQSSGSSHLEGGNKVAGGPHGQAGAKRVFRRKSGG